MKKLIEKFKSAPLPLKWMALVLILWLYPFIYAYSIGASGWFDLNVLSKILMGFSIFPIVMFLWLFGIKPIINTITKINKVHDLEGKVSDLQGEIRGLKANVVYKSRKK